MEVFNIPILIMLIVAAICISAILKITPPNDRNIEFMSLDYTTAVKGIAMLLIMLGHCTGHYIGGRALTPCGGIGVSLFLIASGFGLNESFKKRGLANFWKKRILKVWLPYAIITLLVAPFCSKSLTELGMQLSCLHCLYWFVPYIIECYVVFWILAAVAQKYRLPLMLIMGISTLFCLPELQGEQALGFVFGVFMSEYKPFFTRLSQKKSKMAIIVFCMVSIGLVALAIKQLPLMREISGTWMFCVCQMMIKFPLSLAILFGAYMAPWLVRNPMIAFSGLISYELYLVHFRFYTYIEGRLWPALLLLIGSYIISWIFNKLNNQINKNIA